MLTLYPAIQNYASYNLDVDQLHTLYVEESGNPNGVPVIYIHGGPGSGSEPDNRRFFDPEKYRIILFDQRGSGKSTPHAELTNNNTQALIWDLDHIRQYLDIPQWLLFGGSWGSTLALLYAQAYPQHALGMVLRGIFLARKQDLAWSFKDQGGAASIFPDHWQEFKSIFPKTKQASLIKQCHKTLTGDNEIARMAAAKAWSKWGAVCATLDPCKTLEHHLNKPHLSLSLARIECHYLVNNYFIAENQILDNMDSIKHIPGVIIHGRYDMICPLKNAYDLHQAWHNSTLMIIRDAGHSSREPGILNELIHATNSFSC